MHLERLFFDDGSTAGGVDWNFATSSEALRKWTFLPRSRHGLEFIALVALASCGKNHVQALRAQLAPRRLLCPEGTARLEFVQVRHAPQERGENQPARRGGGWIMAPGGVAPMPRSKARQLDPTVPFGSPPSRQGNKGWLLLAYGRRLAPHQGTDRFVFDDLHHRLERCAPLFDPVARVTDAVAFLSRLNDKGVVNGRGRSRHYLAGLSRELGPLLGLPPQAWEKQRHDFQADWEALAAWQKTAAVLVLDVARHVLEASSGIRDPFAQAGVVLFHGLPEGLASGRVASSLGVFDRLFPNLQFILSLSPGQRALVPAELEDRTLVVPQPTPAPPAPASVRLRPGTALLIDVDSQLPNLALMKLARFFRDRGGRVVLARPGARLTQASEVWASCVFAFPGSAKRVDRLREQYGPDLQVGGSGVDVRKRLPAEIEAKDPDYSLYPELGDRAIGFLTRGCPRHCAFCIVPEKEGRPRVVSDLDGLLQGRRKLILLDDNLLAHRTAPQLLEEMARRDIQVNFNQTLDLRLLTPETAVLLRRIRSANVKFTRRVLHFSLNDSRGLYGFRRHYRWLGTTSRDHVEFVCLYGFDTTLAEDLERFRFLRTLPGAYVFMQRYRPPLGGAEPKLNGFFDDRAEEHMDALIKVQFAQNMKSMEVYYRWVCRLHATQCGRIHRGLVETLYRYNHRHLMAQFLAKLETLCRESLDRNVSDEKPRAQPTGRLSSRFFPNR